MSQRGYLGAVYGSIDYGMIWYAAEDVHVAKLLLTLQLTVTPGETKSVTIEPHEMYVFRNVSVEVGQDGGKLLVDVVTQVGMPECLAVMVEGSQTNFTSSVAKRVAKLRLTHINNTSSNVTCTITLTMDVSDRMLDRSWVYSVRDPDSPVKPILVVRVPLKQEDITAAGLEVKSGVKIIAGKHIALVRLYSDLENLLVANNIPFVQVPAYGLDHALVIVRDTPTVRSLLSQVPGVTILGRISTSARESISTLIRACDDVVSEAPLDGCVETFAMFTEYNIDSYMILPASEMKIVRTSYKALQPSLNTLNAPIILVY